MVKTSGVEPAGRSQMAAPDRISFDDRSAGQHAALVVTDLQPDFLPGGALEIEGGDQVLEGIAGLMGSNRFGTVIATQDWHPRDHISFASSHEGREPLETIELYGHEQVLWPDHCVQGTAGAALHSSMPWWQADLILRKATDPAVDSYSAFRDNWAPDGDRPPTGLAGLLRERGVSKVILCGLARDYCVRWSAEDAADAGFDTVVLWDLTRPVDSDSDPSVAAALEARGVEIRKSHQL
jgi:nicotinamidase/pyrazinamidase